MKYIINFVIALILLTSCEKENPEILDMMLNADDISRVELRADHKTLLPNGVAKMEFHTVVYATRNATGYIKKDEFSLSETVQVDSTFIVPPSQVPAGLVKIFDEAGNELKDNGYSTTTDKPGTVRRFYAQCGSMKSNFVDVTIRELPQEYEQIVVPVIFHMLIKPGAGSLTYDISEAFLAEQLRVVNEVFNAKRTTDPNAGNANIVFKLAEYNYNGLPLKETGRGKNIIFLTDYLVGEYLSDDLRYAADDYNDLMMSGFINNVYWDPNKYLNVYLVVLSNDASDLGTSAYKTKVPSLMHPDYEVNSIPGLSCKTAESLPSKVKSIFEIGFMVNYASFLSLGSRELNLASPFAEYFGVLLTGTTKKYPSLVNGDTDYCDDTYSYNSTLSINVFKTNEIVGQPIDRPIDYFTSYNVMDFNSRKNSISVDQAARIRKVMKQCPDRWAYKSDFAFTGK